MFNVNIQTKSTKLFQINNFNLIDIMENFEFYPGNNNCGKQKKPPSFVAGKIFSRHQEASFPALIPVCKKRPMR